MITLFVQIISLIAYKLETHKYHIVSLQSAAFAWISDFQSFPPKNKQRCMTHIYIIARMVTL